MAVGLAPCPIAGVHVQGSLVAASCGEAIWATEKGPCEQKCRELQFAHRGVETVWRLYLSCEVASLVMGNPRNS